MKYNYQGPFIHGVSEYRINGEVGYINKNGERVHKDGTRVFENSNATCYSVQSSQLLITPKEYISA